MSASVNANATNRSRSCLIRSIAESLVGCSAVGSGSSNTMFGSSGSASFLTRATAWLAIGFFAIAFGLAYIANERAGTVSDVGIPQVEQTDQLTDIPESVDSDAAEEAESDEEFPDDIPDL